MSRWRTPIGMSAPSFAEIVMVSLRSSCSAACPETQNRNSSEYGCRCSVTNSPGFRLSVPRKPEVAPQVAGDSSVRTSPPRRVLAGTSAMEIGRTSVVPPLASRSIFARMMFIWMAVLVLMRSVMAAVSIGAPGRIWKS